jgi:hypothetical protein
MAKNILIFADGTGNAGGLLPDESRTNVYKLYRATRTGPDSIGQSRQDLRIEIPERSDPPAKLTELGYRPLNMGQATWLTNKPGAPSPWVVMDVIAISLPR